MKAKHASEDLKARVRNQERVKEEVGMAVDCALELANLRRTDLAARMGKSRSYVTKILDQHNFTLETLADVCLALDYAVHVYLTRDPTRMRTPMIESDEPIRMGNSEDRTIVVRGPVGGGAWPVISSESASSNTASGAA